MRTRCIFAFAVLYFAVAASSGQDTPPPQFNSPPSLSFAGPPEPTEPAPTAAQPVPSGEPQAVPAGGSAFQDSPAEATTGNESFPALPVAKDPVICILPQDMRARSGVLELFAVVSSKRWLRIADPAYAFPFAPQTVEVELQIQMETDFEVVEPFLTSVLQLQIDRVRLTVAEQLTEPLAIFKLGPKVSAQQVQELLDFTRQNSEFKSVLKTHSDSTGTTGQPIPVGSGHPNEPAWPTQPQPSRPRPAMPEQEAAFAPLPLPSPRVTQDPATTTDKHDDLDRHDRVNSLRSRFEQLEQQSQQQAARIRQLTSGFVAAEEVTRARENLQSTVHQAFKARQELRRAEVAAFEDRLNTIAESLRTQDRLADRIVQRRVAELLNPDLEWQDAPQTLPALPPAEYRPPVDDLLTAPAENQSLTPDDSSTSSPSTSVTPTVSPTTAEVPPEELIWRVTGASFRQTINEEGIHGTDWTHGLEITTLASSGISELGGLRLGDVVVRVGDQSVTNLQDLLSVWGETDLRSSALITFIRNGDEAQASLKLGHRHELSRPTAGVILSRSGEEVTISLGAGDGIRPGDRLLVNSDQNQNLVEMVVVYHTHSSGRILEEDSESPIREGQSVQSEILPSPAIYNPVYRPDKPEKSDSSEAADLQTPLRLLQALRVSSDRKDYRQLVSLLTRDERRRFAGIMLQNAVGISYAIDAARENSEDFQPAVGADLTPFARIRDLLKRYVRSKPPEAVEAYEKLVNRTIILMDQSHDGSEPAPPPMTAAKYSQLLRLSSGVLSDETEFLVEMLEALDKIKGVPVDGIVPDDSEPDWETVINGDQATVTDVRTSDPATQMQLQRIDGQWKISSLLSDEMLLVISVEPMIAHYAASSSPPTDDLPAAFPPSDGPTAPSATAPVP